ncbi:hypothetical protein MCY_01435 [Bartonella rattimassiliensis 15908]|uniref:Uncharacterized protein n=1 Tax=Bartonella rattimassiliensis 15908 TaxID=1094556 RepID=J0ZAL4_9HYPH|nr:hypothetical protein MCY_01435 [Bartonella rattimassiliensis 15908]
MMICGSIAVIKDCARICESFGFVEGANSALAPYVVEHAFLKERRVVLQCIALFCVIPVVGKN